MSENAQRPDDGPLDDPVARFACACERVGKLAGARSEFAWGLEKLDADMWRRLRNVDEEMARELGPLSVELARLGAFEALSRAAAPEVACARAWHSASGGWQLAAIDAAAPWMLPGIARAWILPGVSLATLQGHVSISRPWLRALAEAAARDPSGACMGMAQATIPALVRLDSGPTIEDVNHLLGAMIGRVAAGEFERMLDAAGAACHPQHVPTFASRMQGHFELAFDESRGRAPLGKLSTQAEGEAWAERARRWAERGRPPDPEALVDAARVFLLWCARQDLGAGEVPASARIASLWRPMVEIPQLAPALAVLAKRWGGGLAPLCPAPALEDLHAGMGVFSEGGPASLRALKWEGRPFGPVEQALFAGSLEGARALVEAGFAWRSESFQTLCSGLCELPRLLETGTFGDGRARVRSVAALGEKLSIEREAGAAPSRAPPRI